MTETIQIKVPMWNIESETGYKPRTTFWQDFSIADAFGGDAVRTIITDFRIAHNYAFFAYKEFFRC